MKKTLKHNYKISIRLSQTTLLDYGSCCQQDKIFFSPADTAHILLMDNSKYIYKAMLIKIFQN